MLFIKKHRYVLSQLTVLIVLLVLDQLSKYLALHFLPLEGGFLGFSLEETTRNYALIFGWDFKANPLFISIYLTAIFCILICAYILSLIFIPKNFHYLQTGISIMFAGFSGNYINKITNGFTLDFIKWSAPVSKWNIYFNLADIFQTVAWVFILLQFFFSRKYLWKISEKRSQFLIMKNSQIKFIGQATFIFFCMSFFFLFMNYQFLNLLENIDIHQVKEVGQSFFKYSFFVLLLFCIFMTAFFTYLSNKIYGPLYAFDKYIKSLLKGEKPKDLKLRKNDQLTHLESLAKEIKNKLDKS